ncbi:HlyD family type I secretion periplasmic adaptor subunit [Methyloraptor flagellatus]|uniref:Membrane fusion protein (MFP) family protein n=1 Tax=Methyloraptor flagellatus TaxID=3162530 RepID=A0AAU7XGC0_9HYPH
MGAEIVTLRRTNAVATPVEREFLPAALEIVETPPSPGTRWLGFVLCALFTAVIVWASIGQVDLIATAPGKVVPVGRTKDVQAFEAGTVAKILVDDGTAVKAGQTLILLDPTVATADRDRFREQAMRASLDVARLQALTAPPGTSADPFAGLDASPEAIAEARGRYLADRAGREAKLASADLAIAAKRAEAVSYEAEIGKIDAQLPLVRERTRIRKEGSDKGWGSRLDFLNAAQAEAELVNQRKVVVEKHNAAAAAVQAQIADRERLAAETERDWRSDLQRAMRDRAEATSELAKAERRTGLTSVTSPVDGVVADLRVHTEGGVVQAGQQLLRVVPSHGSVMIEAVVENKDAGFVRAGQEVEVKVDAFSYTHYGLIPGRVAQVSKDSQPDPELMQQSRAAQPLGDSPDAVRRSGALVYVARIEMADPSLMVGGVRTAIEPGMAVTVEIKTGRRTVIDYLLSPIIRQAHEALRER